MPVRLRVAAWACVALGGVALAGALVVAVREGRFVLDFAMLLLPAGLAMLQGHGPSRRWVAFYLGFIVTAVSAMMLVVMTGRLDSVGVAGVQIRTSFQALCILGLVAATALISAWALYSRPSREYFAGVR